MLHCGPLGYLQKILPMSCFISINIDGFVKSPDAALRCTLRHCGVRSSTPHSSGIACLACESFYEAINIVFQRIACMLQGWGLWTIQGRVSIYFGDIVKSP
jgi:hypothetical protein